MKGTNMKIFLNHFDFNAIFATILLIVILTPLNTFGECRLIEFEENFEAVCEDKILSNNESKKVKSTIPDRRGSEFVIDENLILVDLGAFEPQAINNSTEIAGNEFNEKGGPFAGVWKHGFFNILDGPLLVKNSSAIGINDLGKVVGFQRGRYGDDYERAVIWNNGIIEELVFSDGIISRALGINNSGDVVGWVLGLNGFTRAFISKNGTTEILGTLNSGIAINNSGQVLGTINGGNPVLWNNGISQNLATPIQLKLGLLRYKKGYSFTPTCLNDDGQVAGHIDNKAYIWTKDKLQELFTAKEESFIPLGINKHGVLVGKKNNKATVWSSGAATELNRYFKSLRGWKTTEARGINDFGQVIVYASNGIQEQSRAFLVSPKSNIPILIAGKAFESTNIDISQKNDFPIKQSDQEKTSEKPKLSTSPSTGFSDKIIIKNVFKSVSDNLGN